MVNELFAIDENITGLCASYRKDDSDHADGITIFRDSPKTDDDYMCYMVVDLKNGEEGSYPVHESTKKYKMSRFEDEAKSFEESGFYLHDVTINFGNAYIGITWDKDVSEGRSYGECGSQAVHLSDE